MARPHWITLRPAGSTNTSSLLVSDADKSHCPQVSAKLRVGGKLNGALLLRVYRYESWSDPGQRGWRMELLDPNGSSMVTVFAERERDAWRSMMAALKIKGYDLSDELAEAA